MVMNVVWKPFDLLAVFDYFNRHVAWGCFVLFCCWVWMFIFVFLWDRISSLLQIKIFDPVARFDKSFLVMLWTTVHWELFSNVNRLATSSQIYGNLRVLGISRFRVARWKNLEEPGMALRTHRNALWDNSSAMRDEWAPSSYGTGKLQ